MLESPTLASALPPTTPRRNWRRIAFACAFAAVFALCALTAVAVARVAASLGAVRESAAAAETALRGGDFTAADAALTEALAAIRSAQGGLRIAPFLRAVPWAGTQIRGLAAALEAGAETIGALAEAVRVVVGVEAVTREAQALVGVTGGGAVPYGELAASARVALLRALNDAHPQLLTMQVKLGLVRASLARLDALPVTPRLREAAAPLRDLIEELGATVDLLTPFSAAVPELAGLGEDRQFLLLFANNTELRPGGGFLGVYGLALTRDGEVVAMTTDDVYNVDNLAADAGYNVNAPPPLVSWLQVPKWYFRDSNWSPDFPTSTKDGVQLFRQEVAYAGLPVPEIHGALMLTPAFIGRVLGVTGPITVDGQTFTAENIADALEYQVEIGYAEQGIPRHQRKDVVARMAGILMDRVLAMPPSAWPSLFTVFADGFTEKEIALWSADAAMQATYADAGWDGAVAQGSADDVLMVVDANLAALKTDPVVDRTITYAVQPSADGYRATVSITYDHRGSFSWNTSRYRTYTRVYAPLGSTLLAAEGTLRDDATRNPTLEEGEVATADELGMTSFGAFTAVEPGERRTLSFTYLLPPSVEAAIADGLYELRVVKQLGAADHELVLDIDFDRDLARAEPGEAEADWGDDVYHLETVLATDATFTVLLE